MKKLYLLIYYGFATHLPGSYMPVVGRMSNAIRVFCAKRIFKKCGKITTIDRHAYFGNGSEIEIGDYSGIGENCVVPHNTRIGRYVMMAPEVHIVANNHKFADTSIPMCFQKAEQTHLPTTIGDDCWIGVRSILTPGPHHWPGKYHHRRIGCDTRCATLYYSRGQPGKTHTKPLWPLESILLPL